METDKAGPIVRSIKIREKKIYIVKNHHEVILPWSEYASETENAPILLTFDHHADTRSAFYRHAKEVAGQEWELVKDQLIAKVEINEPTTIAAALEKLRNNEHIDFALQTGILSDAIIFSLLSVGVCRDYANDKICYIDPCCTSKCKKSSHDEECQIDVYNNVIEGQELLYKLNKINRFIPGFFVADRITQKYILDIDLDSFSTKKAINPEDLTVFYYLVRNAEIITIATEGDYVELEKIEEDINEDYLLEKLLIHIENALEREEEYGV